jgi:threonine dehydratase
MSASDSDFAIGPDDIRAAAETITGAVIRTPTVPASSLMREIDCQLYLKLENLQLTGSFKVRGALNRMVQLTEAEQARGVITMSAGNHAQGVAFHAQRLGIPATIVMPRHTPFTKVARTEAFGATVELVGDTLDEGFAHVRQRIERDGLTLIHPYDDPAIMAGQGTIGLEMLADVPHLDTLVVPIGGGGLISGIAIAAKAIKPSIRIIGVQSALYPAMIDALALHNEPVPGGATIAEGIAVKKPGALTRPVVAALVDELVTVGEAALEQAVNRLATDQKIVVEGAGAAGVAALLDRPDAFAGRHVGLVLCGGNIDARLLSGVLMRGLARTGQLVRLRIGIDDAPGALARVSGAIGDNGGNIVEVYHLRMAQDLPLKRADIDVVIETRDRPHVERIMRALGEAGFDTELQTDLGH